MALASIITSIVTGGSNNHATVAEEANAYATDFITQGVLGNLANSSGLAPMTGSFGVNQNTGTDMAISVTGTGNTTNGQSVAYITCAPSSQGIQVLRARMPSNSTGYTISANSSGSTKYDWVYLQASATNANVPDSSADNVVALYTSRSTSNTADNGSPPTFGIPLAIVAVSNGATSIVNANITDIREQVVFTSSGVLTVANLFNPYKFFVYRNSALSLATGVQLVTFDTKLYDTGTNYSTSTGKFTATVNGFYSFSGVVSIQPFANDVDYIEIYKNGSFFLQQHQGYTPSTNNWGGVISISNLQLLAGDYIQVYYGHGNAGNAAVNAGASPYLTWFSGGLSSAT